MDRSGTGLLLLALAPALWLLAALLEGANDLLPGGIFILVGLALATLQLGDERSRSAAFGFLLAAFGIFVFYNGTFAGGGSPFAGGVFCLANLLCTVGAWTGGRRLLSIGFYAMAAAGLLWVFVDLGGQAWLWQPGNILALVGALLAGMGYWAEANEELLESVEATDAGDVDGPETSS